MKNRVLINDIRIHAFHGVMPQERIVGADFIINVKIDTDFTHAMKTDDLTGTISYADVYDVIKQEMMIPSALLEHVGARIVNQIFGRFEQAKSIWISIVKENPPMGADCKGAGIEICLDRSDIECVAD